MPIYYPPLPTGGATTLDGLTDVDASAPDDGAFVAWDAASSLWRAAQSVSDSNGDILTDSNGNMIVTFLP